MTKQEAEQIIADVCRQGVKLRFTAHFWQRVRQRLPELKKHHVFWLLRSGVLQGEPLHDADRNNYKIKVVGLLPDFGRIEVVLAISWVKDAVCLTIYEKR